MLYNTISSSLVSAGIPSSSVGATSLLQLTHKLLEHPRVRVFLVSFGLPCSISLPTYLAPITVSQQLEITSIKSQGLPKRFFRTRAIRNLRAGISIAYVCIQHTLIYLGVQHTNNIIHKLYNSKSSPNQVHDESEHHLNHPDQLKQPSR